jgi:hypothetical protein
MMEVDSLKHATMATVSKLGLGLGLPKLQVLS